MTLLLDEIPSYNRGWTPYPSYLFSFQQSITLIVIKPSSTHDNLYELTAVPVKMVVLHGTHKQIEEHPSLLTLQVLPGQSELHIPADYPLWHKTA